MFLIRFLVQDIWCYAPYFVFNLVFSKYSLLCLHVLCCLGIISSTILTRSNFLNVYYVTVRGL